MWNSISRSSGCGFNFFFELNENSLLPASRKGWSFVNKNVKAKLVFPWLQLDYLVRSLTKELKSPRATPVPLTPASPRDTSRRNILQTVFPLPRPIRPIHPFYLFYFFFVITTYFFRTLDSRRGRNYMVVRRTRHAADREKQSERDTKSEGTHGGAKSYYGWVGGWGNHDDMYFKWI